MNKRKGPAEDEGKDLLERKKGIIKFYNMMFTEVFHFHTLVDYVDNYHLYQNKYTTFFPCLWRFCPPLRWLLDQEPEFNKEESFET